MKTKFVIAFFLCLSIVGAHSVVLTWNASNPCDINIDGKVDAQDVTLATNMALKNTPCKAIIETPLVINGVLTNVCTVLTLESVVNYIVTGQCTTKSAAVTGYYIYRAVSGAPSYTKITTSPVAALTYTDLNVTAGTTYFYVASATDALGEESAVSMPPAQATIPVP